jgi:hypothetical protein
MCSSIWGSTSDCPRRSAAERFQPRGAPFTTQPSPIGAVHSSADLRSERARPVTLVKWWTAAQVAQRLVDFDERMPLARRVVGSQPSATLAGAVTARGSCRSNRRDFPHPEARRGRGGKRNLPTWERAAMPPRALGVAAPRNRWSGLMRLHGSATYNIYVRIDAAAEKARRALLDATGLSSSRVVAEALLALKRAHDAGRVTLTPKPRTEMVK